MKSLLIILLFVFFCCGPFYMLCAKGMDKAEKKGCDGCVVMFIIFFMFVLTLCGLFGMCKSCTDEGPSYDYYDSPRK